MTLREILKGKNNILTKEYERFGDRLIFIGATYSAGGQLISLDGGFYTLDLEPCAYEWDDDGNLMIVRWANDD